MLRDQKRRCRAFRPYLSLVQGFEYQPGVSSTSNTRGAALIAC